MDKHVDVVPVAKEKSGCLSSSTLQEKTNYCTEECSYDSSGKASVPIHEEVPKVSKCTYTVIEHVDSMLNIRVLDVYSFHIYFSFCA